MSARCDGIQKFTCVKFLNDAFEWVLLTVVLKDKLTGLKMWEDNRCLPDSFFSGHEAEEEVGAGPLGHDGRVETLP